MCKSNYSHIYVNIMSATKVTECQKKKRLVIQKNRAASCKVDLRTATTACIRLDA